MANITPHTPAAPTALAKGAFRCCNTMENEQELKRRGRWIVEEEEFARACINAFSRGMLAEVEDGTTLRSYLASRLHCQPMRVTKKLHGSKGMGKRLYRRAQDSNPASVDAVAHELKVLEERLAAKLLANSDGWPGLMDRKAAQEAASASSALLGTGQRDGLLAGVSTGALREPRPPERAGSGKAGYVGDDVGAPGGSGHKKQRHPSSANILPRLDHRRRQSTGAALAAPPTSTPRSAAGEAAATQVDCRRASSDTSCAVAEATPKHRRRRIYSVGEAFQTKPSKQHHRQNLSQRKEQKRDHERETTMDGGGGELSSPVRSPAVPLSFLDPTASTNHGKDNDDDDDNDNDNGYVTGDASESERRSTAAFIAAVELIDNAGPVHLGSGLGGCDDVGATSGDSTCPFFDGGGSFSSYRSDSGYSSLLSSAQGESGSRLEIDGVGSTTFTDHRDVTPRTADPATTVDPSQPPTREQQQKSNTHVHSLYGREIPPEAALGYAMAPVPRLDQYAVRRASVAGGNGSAGSDADYCSSLGHSAIERQRVQQQRQKQQQQQQELPCIAWPWFDSQRLRGGVSGITPPPGSTKPECQGLCEGSNDTERTEGGGGATTASEEAASSSMVTGVDNWQSLPCSAALTAAPLSSAAGFAGAAMARASSRITLENATMDDWIPGAAETTTGPQNETLGLPLVSEGSSCCWLNQTTSQSVAQGVSAATAPAAAPAAAGIAEQIFDTWLMP